VKNRTLRHLAGDLAILSLCVCLGSAVLFFLGRITEPAFKTAFLVASIAWFVLSIARGETRKDPLAG
jgi:CHASE2 domain-containing sensor protein